MCRYFFVLITALSLSLVATGCGEEEIELDDEALAARLLSRLAESEYREWNRPAGFEERTASETHHGAFVDVYMNDVLYDAVGGEPRDYWPDESIVVKDGWDAEGVRTEIAAMEKVDGEWFYALWDGTGEFQSAGQPAGCVNCHADGYDYLRAIPLP